LNFRLLRNRETGHGRIAKRCHAVGFSPRNRAAKGSPRRVATPELFATSRSRGLFCIAVPACPAAAGSSR
jgi:hypothetical protein